MQAGMDEESIMNEVHKTIAFSGMASLPQGYRALVIGSSGGIGGALAEALRGDAGCGEVLTLSRSGDAFDLTSEASIAAAAERLAADRDTFDLVLCATGGLTINGKGPEKSLKAIAPDIMAMQFAVNAIGPALVLKHFAPLMPRQRRAIFAALSARVGSIGDNKLGGWISYRSAKAALNQIIRTASIEIARTSPQSVVVGLHPGTVETKLTAPFSSGHAAMRPAESAAHLLSVLDSLTPQQSGGFFAYDGSVVEW